MAEALKGFDGVPIAFSFALPDPTFKAKDDGNFEGVFEPLPVKQEVDFLAERGSCF